MNIGWGVIFLATVAWAQSPLDPVPIPEIDQVKMLMEKKKWSEAIERLKAWQATGTSPFDAGWLLSRAYVLSGDRDRSLEVLYRLREKETGKKREQVEKQIKIISNLFITNKTFQVYRDGVDLLITGRSRLAQDRFKTVIETEKNNELAWVRLGQSLVLEGDYEQGRKAFESALKIDPSDGLAKAWLGRTSFLAGKLVQAEKELEDGMRQSPELEETACWGSEALYAVGKKSKAIELLRSHTERYPFHLMAGVALIRLEFADSEENLKRLSQLRKQIQVSISRMSSHDEAGLYRYEGEQGIGFKKIEELKKELFVLLERIDAKVAGSKTQ